MEAVISYIEERIPGVIDFALGVVVAIIIFFVGRALIRWLLRIVSRSMEHANVDKGVQQFTDQLLRIVLYAALVIIIAVNLGFDTTSVAAVITSCGLAVGLALQGSLSNFAGGVLILVLQPFKVGDYIEDTSSGKSGSVTEIQLFYTKLTTLDGRVVVIPNGTLSNNTLINYTALEVKQLDLKINISYDSDLKKAKEVIQNVLEEDEGVLHDRPMTIFVDKLGDSAVVIGARAMAEGSTYYPTLWRVTENIKLALDENGIIIPLPQMTVHMAEE